MPSMELFNIVAGLASIGGGAFSLWQALEAKKAAENAKEIEKNISHHRETSDISRLKEKADALTLEIGVYGPGANATRYSTADHGKNSEMIQDFVLKVTEFQDCFKSPIKAQVLALVSDVETELRVFNTHGINDSSRKESGSKILSKVSMMNSKFKSVLDKKIVRGS